MTIYISHSTNFDYKNDLYQPLKVLAENHTVIFPHDENERQYPVKNLLLSKKCDVVIAEVSYPSTGQGIELGWADICKTKIICIYRKDSSYSKALELISNNFIEYTIGEDFMEKIKEFI